MDAAEAARVSAWLGAEVRVHARATGGSSNVTWFVDVDGTPAVLRHPPRDRVALPTAHDLGREARVLRALDGTRVPVPRVLAECTDVGLLGVPFVVTERVDGVCLVDATPPAIDPVALAHHALDALADLHDVDAARLDPTPRHAGYLARQIDRWRDQLDRTPTASRLGDLAPIAEWLHHNRPADEERRIVHGDYGFHNLLVTRASVTAVLDWELATVGDPVADLHSFLKSWGADAHTPNPANDVVARAAGAPTRDALLARYEARTGRPVRRHQHFYEAFGVWRSIGIFEGIHARTDGARFAEETPQLVARIRAMMSGDPHPR